MTANLPSRASEMGVPETVIVPPGVNVRLAIRKSDAAFAVYVEPANVIISGPEVACGAFGRNCVLLPTIANLPSGASEIGVPETVIALPGVNI